MGIIDKPNYMISGMIEYATRVLPYESEDEMKEAHIEYIRENFLDSAKELSDTDLALNIEYLKAIQNDVESFGDFSQFLLSNGNGTTIDRLTRFKRHAFTNLHLSSLLEVLAIANETSSMGIEILNAEIEHRKSLEQQSLKPRI